MIYLYDNAIVDDLKSSFNPDNVPNPVVKVIDPDGIVDLAAQIQDDKISFPLVALTRNPDVQIDQTRMNFTRLHRGVATVIDTETNNLYYERIIPIQLRYAVTILATNTADCDELTRELLFKYSSEYFLTIKLPYESDRKTRFGVSIDPDASLESSSGSLEYMRSGQLYQRIIPLTCNGCVLVHYTPAHLKRLDYDVEAILKSELQRSEM